jgi:hypothetical protein
MPFDEIASALRQFWEYFLSVFWRLKSRILLGELRPARRSRNQSEAFVPTITDTTKRTPSQANSSTIGTKNHIIDITADLLWRF